jgi:hypothetical protein
LKVTVLSNGERGIQNFNTFFLGVCNSIINKNKNNTSTVYKKIKTNTTEKSKAKFEKQLKRKIN